MDGGLACHEQMVTDRQGPSAGEVGAEKGGQRKPQYDLSLPVNEIRQSKGMRRILVGDFPSLVNKWRG